MDSAADFLTPDDVVAVGFETRRRGLDPDQVERHLRRVAESLRAVVSDNEALRAELSGLRREIEQSRAEREHRELSDEELAERLGAEAERRRTAVAEELAQTRAEAGAEAARLVDEAQIVRRRILEDLARRRSLARRQIEQLRVGRDRLISSHETLRRALDEISDELRSSMAEARAAAESAGHSVPETTIEELEAEIETARLSGLLDTGPVPVIGDDERRDQPDGSRHHTSGEASGPDAADSGDPVDTDSTVADLFARMRSTQTEAASGVSGATSTERHSRTEDSLRQR